jgi:hypothetical protein
VEALRASADGVNQALFQIVETLIGFAELRFTVQADSA